MLDIHAHLYWESYNADRDAVVGRARETGVGKMICVGTSPEDNPKAIEVTGKYENIWAAVGIHPHYFNELEIENQKSPTHHSDATSESSSLAVERGDWIRELRALAKHPKVIAIGECGLDYFSRSEKVITEAQKAAQKEGFIAQIKLAEELKLPLIIHTRPSLGSADAYEDLFDIFQNHLSSIKHLSSHFILHCYQGDIEITKKFLDLPNVYFSFAGNITYSVKKSMAGTKNDLQETVKLVPLERLFVETDSPFLAPESKRGERNEPAYVWLTARKVCALKNIAEDTLEAALDENFQRVFAR
jgi:TatD DNase family protein